MWTRFILACNFGVAKLCYKVLRCRNRTREISSGYSRSCDSLQERRETPRLSAKFPPRAERSTSAEATRRPCLRQPRARPLLLLLERDPGGLRGLVVFRFGLLVLARYVQGVGLHRERPGVGRARVKAGPDSLVDLSL